MHPPTGTYSAPKLSILRSKIENKKISGEGAQHPPQTPSPWGEVTPPHASRSLRPPGFDHIPLHQLFLDPPLLCAIVLCSISAMHIAQS